jgi:TatD DNase family protein
MAHEGLYPTFGIHPWVAAKMVGDEPMEVVAELVATMQRIVPIAIGELGLDRSKRCPKESLPAQVACFRGQLAVAKQVGLPVVLHIVRAHGMALEILKEIGLSVAGGFLHSFSGSAEMAREYQRLGLHISFSAALLRAQGTRLEDAVRAVSANRLLIETDAPDQGPDGRSHGEPADLVAVRDAVAKIRGESPETVGRRSATNAAALFDLLGWG